MPRCVNVEGKEAVLNASFFLCLWFRSDGGVGLCVLDCRFNQVNRSYNRFDWGGNPFGVIYAGSVIFVVAYGY